ncbi:MAG: type 1 glutamine amidotransferase domain-containing protein [Bacteroidota bacterium]
MSKNILIIAANPTTSTTTGWPVGFWVSEVSHPYKVFREAGHHVTIASPAGGQLEMDALSNPFDSSGYSSWDEISKEVLGNSQFTNALENSVALGDVNPDVYDAVVVAGGQAPMFNFEKDKNLHNFFSRFYETGKPTAALCHGTAILRYAQDKTGKPLVAGKRVTGFTNGEEDDADKAAGTKVMPWRIEDELTNLGATFLKADNWQPFVIVDGNLITGQQNMSGEAVAKEVMMHLEK